MVITGINRAPSGSLLSAMRPFKGMLGHSCPDHIQVHVVNDTRQEVRICLHGRCMITILPEGTLSTFPLIANTRPFPCLNGHSKPEKPFDIHKPFFSIGPVSMFQDIADQLFTAELNGGTDLLRKFILPEKGLNFRTAVSLMTKESQIPDRENRLIRNMTGRMKRASSQSIVTGAAYLSLFFMDFMIEVIGFHRSFSSRSALMCWRRVR